MIIETHVHICDSKYDNDREEVLKRAESLGIKKFINIGAEAGESGKVADFDREGVYKALGLHPHYAQELNAALEEEFRGYFKRKKNIVAVGEVGLDYFKSATSRDLQETVFKKFLNMAKEFDLPVIIHSRDAFDDVYAILKEYDTKKRGVIHCFSGGIDTAGKFIDDGWMLGIGGVITFPNAGELRAAVAQVPLEFLVLETDAPWLAPQQVRGQRNEPAYLRHIVSAIAGIKGVTEEEVERVTTGNAEKIFNL